MQYDLSQQSEPCNLQAQKLMSVGKQTSESHDYSHENSTLKSSGKPETITEKNSVSFNEDSIELGGEGGLSKLTGKQKQYLKDEIYDQNGNYTFLDNPDQYKKARKRLQNRESAVRSRQRNKYYQKELEDLIEEQNALILQLTDDKKELKEGNAALSSENIVLKQQLSYFQETFANSSMIEGDQNQLQPVPMKSEQVPNDILRQEDLKRLELEILSKVNASINQRFTENYDKDLIKPSLSPQKTDSDHIIRPEGFPQFEDILHDRKDQREPLEKMMGEDYDGLKQRKRPRFHDHSDEEDSYDPQERLVLQRNTSLFSNNGFMFLAAVSCIVCCSSFIDTTASSAGSFAEPTFIINTGKQMKSTILNQLNQMDQQSNLQASNVGDYQLSDEEIQKREHQKTQNLGTQTVTNQLLNQVSPQMQVYAYVTYLILSCIGFFTFVYSFFKWLLPNVFESPQIEQPKRVHSRHSRKSRKEPRGQRKYLPETQETILDI